MLLLVKIGNTGLVGSALVCRFLYFHNLALTISDTAGGGNGILRSILRYRGRCLVFLGVERGQRYQRYQMCVTQYGEVREGGAQNF